MEELLKTGELIDSVLKSRGDTELTPQAFEDQMVSFVVGNAFDVFRDPESVTSKTVVKHQNMRRSPRG